MTHRHCQQLKSSVVTEEEGCHCNNKKFIQHTVGETKRPSSPKLVNCRVAEAFTMLCACISVCRVQTKRRIVAVMHTQSEKRSHPSQTLYRTSAVTKQPGERSIRRKCGTIPRTREVTQDEPIVEVASYTLEMNIFEYVCARGTTKLCRNCRVDNCFQQRRTFRASERVQKTAPVQGNH